MDKETYLQKIQTFKATVEADSVTPETVGVLLEDTVGMYDDQIEAEVNKEASRRQAADQALGERIDQTGADLNAEISERERRDESFSQELRTEAMLRSEEDSVLLEALQRVGQSLTQSIADIQHPIAVEDTEDADLIIADKDSRPILTVKNGHVKTANFDSANIRVNTGTSTGSTTAHPVEVRDTDEADLIIADDEGNIIATFADGHIRTANFDSANISASQGQQGEAGSGTEDTESPYQGLKFSIIGDSISTYSGTMPSGYATYYPQGDITSQEKTWWAKVAKALGMTLLRNCSWSGTGITGVSTSTTSPGVGCSDRRIADLADGDTHPDVIFIWIGINDWGGGEPLGQYTSQTQIPTDRISQFAPAYAACVTKAMAAYPAAKICCCTLPEVKTQYNNPNADFPRVNSASATVADYNAAIAAVCQATGATLIDLHACGITHWNAHTYTIDGLHPNNAGSTLAADKIISTLLYNR